MLGWNGVVLQDTATFGGLSALVKFGGIFQVLVIFYRTANLYCSFRSGIGCAPKLYDLRNTATLKQLQWREFLGWPFWFVLSWRYAKVSLSLCISVSLSLFLSLSLSFSLFLCLSLCGSLFLSLSLCVSLSLSLSLLLSPPLSLFLSLYSALFLLFSCAFFPSFCFWFRCCVGRHRVR